MARRIELVEALATELVARSEEAMVTQTRELGAPVKLSRRAARVASLICAEYVKAAHELPLVTSTDDRAGAAVVLRKPVGVVAAIGAWNGPLLVVANKAVPALLAGCTVVVKPAAETPFDAGLFADAATAVGFPPGAVNVVPGGRETGAALVRHLGVDITFTGSTAAGRRIGAIAGESLTRMSLELGGKSAGVVLQDAVLEGHDPRASTRQLRQQWSGAHGAQPVLVPRTRHDEFVDRTTA